jgi:peptide/nickel transport system permease protein
LPRLLKFPEMNLKVKIGFIIFLPILALAILEPIINYVRLKGVDPTRPGKFERLLPPSFEHPLGTDMFGRDVIAFMLIGVKYTLMIGVISGTIVTVIAIILSFLAGYKGGFYDHIIRSATDFMLVLPSWPILAIIAAYSKYIDLLGMSLILAIFGWPGMARGLRSQVLSLRERPYVELARVSGLSDIEIIFKELIVNILPYIGVGWINAIIGAMLAETGLRFIGVGPTYLPTLGYIITEFITHGFLTGRYYALLAPIAILCLIFLSLNIINAGLEEAFNPRLKKITGL